MFDLGKKLISINKVEESKLIIRNTIIVFFVRNKKKKKKTSLCMICCRLRKCTVVLQHMTFGGQRSKAIVVTLFLVPATSVQGT